MKTKRQLIRKEFNIDSCQFTQIAFDVIHANYVVSVFFRITGVFMEMPFENYSDAQMFYEKLIS